ncbi:MAG: flagellar biosynthesis protein FlhF [Thermodesulfovibrionales bacterium]
MKIKKFRARTFSEALTMVKKEFGEDAIVLSTEEKRGLSPSVEITAAIDYDICNENNKYAELAKGYKPENSNRMFQQRRGDFSDELGDETESIHINISSLKKHGSEISRTFNKKLILDFLRSISIREEFAIRLCEKAKDLNDLPALISADIKIKEPSIFNPINSGRRNSSKYKKAIMLIGPTGVGKTTTIAKLAANSIKAGKKVGIISLDTYRIGAIEQMRIYSRIMGIPFSITSDIEELKNSLIHFAKNRDIIFIDTSGRNPKDEIHIRDLINISQIGFPVELHLLMSANSDDEFMAEAYQYYRRLPIDCISYTKVDEAVRFGSLYNLLLTYQRPIAYITTGQKVPDDIEFVTLSKVTNLILKRGHYKC